MMRRTDDEVDVGIKEVNTKSPVRRRSAIRGPRKIDSLGRRSKCDPKIVRTASEIN